MCGLWLVQVNFSTNKSNGSMSCLCVAVPACVQMSSACRRYQSDMAELLDQVRLLYREYSNSTASWQQKWTSAEKQVRGRMMPWRVLTWPKPSCLH